MKTVRPSAVEDEQLRLVDERRREHHLLPLALRKVAAQNILLFLDLEEVQPSGDPST
jgi:hypothetical protein